MAKKKINPTNTWRKPQDEMWAAFEKVISTETPRGQIIIHAAMIEDGLTRLLFAYLADREATEKLFEGFHSPLGSFSSKINVACALGLIDENEYGALNLLREIRNAAAHKMQPVFENRSIIDRLADHNKRMMGQELGDTKDHHMMLVSHLAAAVFNRISLIGTDADQNPRLGTQIWSNTREYVVDRSTVQGAVS